MNQFQTFHLEMINNFESKYGYSFKTYLAVENIIITEKLTTKNKWVDSIKNKEQVGSFAYTITEDITGIIKNIGETRSLNRLNNYHCCSFNKDLSFNKTAKSNGKGNVSKNIWMVEDVLSKGNNLSIQIYEFLPIYGSKNQPFFPPLQEGNIKEFYKKIFNTLPEWNIREIEDKLW